MLGAKRHQAGIEALSNLLPGDLRLGHRPGSMSPAGLVLCPPLARKAVVALWFSVGIGSGWIYNATLFTNSPNFAREHRAKVVDLPCPTCPALTSLSQQARALATCPLLQ